MLRRFEHSKLLDCAGRVCRLLRASTEGASVAELARGARAKAPTVRKALRWLVEQGAPIEYDAASRRRVLTDRAFTLPLLDPEPDDVTALVVASALLAPVVDPATLRRVARVIEELEKRVRERSSQPPPDPAWITTSVTMATSADPTVVRTILRSVRQRVLRIRYYRPWSDERSEHVVEPWHVRLQDGAMYLWGWSRTRKAPRTFGVAFIESCVALPGERLQRPAPVSPAGFAWDPAFGVDEHDPGVACLRVRGPLARWLHRVQWHPREVDTWIVEGEVLERRIPYRSRREFARRVLTVIDAVESIEPRALRDEVHGYLDAYAKRRPIDPNRIEEIS